jgi:hypothetical protein
MVPPKRPARCNIFADIGQHALDGAIAAARNALNEAVADAAERELSNPQIAERLLMERATVKTPDNRSSPSLA